MTKGQRIKELLDRSGMSRTDFAAKIGASKQTVYKYENDIVTNIPSDMIERICRVLNVSPGYLMGWEDSVGNVSPSMQLALDAVHNQEMNTYFSQLNDAGKKRAISLVKDLCDIPKYNSSFTGLNSESIA